jgi:hypothetical protein
MLDDGADADADDDAGLKMCSNIFSWSLAAKAMKRIFQLVVHRFKKGLILFCNFCMLITNFHIFWPQVLKSTSFANARNLQRRINSLWKIRLMQLLIGKQNSNRNI